MDFVITDFLGPRPGCNCWDFVRELVAKRDNIEVPPLPMEVLEAYRSASRDSGLKDTLVQGWAKVEEAQEGDILFMSSRGNRAQHAGLFVNGAILHYEKGIGGVWQNICAVKQKWNIVGIYRKES